MIWNNASQLLNFYPGDCEIEEDCRCNMHWVDENCFRATLLSYYPNEPMVCWGCFYLNPHELTHTCLILKCEKLVWRNLLTKSLLKKEHFDQLFEIYIYLHRGKNTDTALETNFKHAVKYILKTKLGEVLNDVLEKDRIAL